MNLRPVMLSLWLGTLIGACGGRVDDIDASSGDEPGGSGATSGSGASSSDAPGRGGRAASDGRPGGAAGAAGAGAADGGGPGQGGAGSGGAQGGDSGGSGGVASESGGAGGSGGGDGARGGAGSSGGDGSVAEVWVGQCDKTITYPDVKPYTDYEAVPQHVVLVVSTSAEGIVTGSIVFGDHAPPPRATDPDAFYPPGAEGGDAVVPLRERPFNGFAYTLRDLHIQDGRLTAWFQTSELWKDWCALQTRSYPASNTYEEGYWPGTCAPDDAPTSRKGGGPVKGDLCLRAGPSVCVCEDDVCEAYPDDLWRTRLDIELRGALYEGRLEDDLGTFGLDDQIPWLKLRRVE